MMATPTYSEEGLVLHTLEMGIEMHVYPDNSLSVKVIAYTYEASST